jgi:hypothetical protein
MMIGKVMSHHHGPPITAEDERFQLASKLYIEVSLLANKLTEEVKTGDFLTLSSSLALTFTALCKLCDRYSRPSKSSGSNETPLSSAAITMQGQAIDGIKTVSQSIVEFSQKLEEATSTSQDFDRVSPIIMDALYAAAANYAWFVRENGDENSQKALDSLRQCLRNLGSRWRNAAEYLRILEAQEVSIGLKITPSNYEFLRYPELTSICSLPTRLAELDLSDCSLIVPEALPQKATVVIHRYSTF